MTTAAEFMAELAKDEKYQALMRKKKRRFALLEKIYVRDEKELIQDLSRIGFPVNSVWDFVNSPTYYANAAPVLIDHLKKKHHPRITQGIVRSLIDKCFIHDDELWALLVNLYKTTPSDEDISIASKRGLQQAVAFALEILATKPRLKDLEDLIRACPDGDNLVTLQKRSRALQKAKK